MAVFKNRATILVDKKYGNEAGKLVSAYGEYDEGEAGLKIFNRRLHTDGDDLFWEEEKLNGKVLPFLVDLTAQVNGETQVFNIPDVIIPDTFVALFYAGQRQSYGYNYEINFATHELTTLFSDAPDSLDGRRLELIVWLEESLHPVGGGDFILLPATASRLGGVKTGDFVRISGDGTISVMPSDFISDDPDNSLQLGSDNKLFISQSETGGITDVLVHGTTVVDDGVATIDLTAQNVFFDSLIKDKLHASNVQDAIDEVDEEMRYNAIYEFDATVQSAPPNLPRGHNWFVKIHEPLHNTHQYSRYFYASVEDAMLDVIGTPNISAAVAHWAIDGKHIYFEYLENGSVNTVVDITDISGNVLLNIFRPIPNGDVRDVWFFGENQLDIFPSDDTIRSILEINVWGLSLMLGNTYELDTENKELVGAVNEVNAKAGIVHAVEKPDTVSAQDYSENNHGVFVYVAKQ